MKILQLDTKSIRFEMIRPEATVYEDVEKKAYSADDAVVLLVSVESGDTDADAKKAVEDAERFMKAQKRSRLVIYPFAHLSSNLERPEKALSILKIMRAAAEGMDIELVSAPFGWNKSLSLDIKGHPMAEQSRSYGSGAADKKEIRARNAKDEIDTAIVRKSDFSGLPETDHRVIGERLDLFSFQEVSPGSVYWHNNGLIIYRELTRFIREIIAEKGYKEVSMPTLSNLALWGVSGHLEHFRNNMFIVDMDGERLGMKPMNCPSTILVYKSRKWSYKELPFRAACFDRVYRNEISGALTGLFRVREMTQDDAHLFIREDQIGEELNSVIELISRVYDTFGLKYTINLSTMPENHLGDEKVWHRATDIVKEILDRKGIKYQVKDGEGAFYGPKIDIDAFDSLGRKWQCGTVQVDFQLPMRFGIEYTGEDGKQHAPVIIHRALLGTLERFIGIMIEHYQGRLPVWLSPVQARVISISEQANAYAGRVYDELRKSGIRTEFDDSDKTLEYKIREAQMQKIPYMLVIGKKEEEKNTVAVRDRSGKTRFGMALEEFIKGTRDEIEFRRQ